MTNEAAGRRHDAVVVGAGIAGLDVWVAELIRETARLVGAWTESPSWVQSHRWRFARSDRGSEMSRPLALRVPGGGRVIITGESFVPGGGIEAAWLAGIARAQRFLEEE